MIIWGRPNLLRVVQDLILKGYLILALLVQLPDLLVFGASNKKFMEITHKHRCNSTRLI